MWKVGCQVPRFSLKIWLGGVIMFKELTILILILAAGIFVSCGADKEIVGGGLTVSYWEPGDGDFENGDDSKEGEDNKTGGKNEIQTTGTLGGAFSLKDMMFDVHQWLPQIPEIDEGNYSDEDAAKNMVADLFKPECHMYNQVNVCPEDEDIVLGNKFSLGTILGLIEHAGMYSLNIFNLGNVYHDYRTCSAGNGPAELVDHTAVFDPPDSDMFTVDFHDLFDCVTSLASSSTESVYALHSKSVGGKVFASLVTRKQIKGAEWYTGIMSDLFQSYVKTDADGKPQLIASNLASFDEKNTGNFSHRSLIIVNMETRRLAAKTVDIRGGGIVLLGGTGEDGEGYYMAKTGSTDDGAYSFCVWGYARESSFVDNSECDNLEGMSRFFLPDNWAARELYTWLGMDADDIKDLSGFDGFFSNSNFLSADLAPQNGVDYFPDSISK